MAAGTDPQRSMSIKQQIYKTGGTLAASGVATRTSSIAHVFSEQLFLERDATHPSERFWWIVVLVCCEVRSSAKGGAQQQQ
jgi:hypothetical protein